MASAPVSPCTPSGTPVLLDILLPVCNLFEDLKGRVDVLEKAMETKVATEKFEADIQSKVSNEIFEESRETTMNHVGTF